MQNVNMLKPVLIQSAAFKDVFLRMDGNGITVANGSGAGEVNCQTSIALTGAFKIHPQKDGTFAIESVKFPGVYLRMDGSRVCSFAAPGAGIVNCQFSAGDWERFKLNNLNDGSFTIESVAFPNVFLRMDGNNPSKKEEDYGNVNCQYGAGNWENFYLMNFPETGKTKDLLNKIHL